MSTGLSQSLLKFALVLIGLTASTGPAYAEMVRPGYVQDIQAEKNEQYYEIYLSPPTVETKAVDLRGKIFNQQLTTEFRGRYEQKFGYIDTDSMAFADRFTNFTENRGAVQGLAQANEDRRAFAEYMMKRLGEYHFDNYMKSDPRVRPLYEAKERLSNISVEVTPETKMMMNYALADNSIEIKYVNPYVDSKFRTEMDPKQIGPSSVVENWVYIGKNLSKTLYLLSSYATMDGLAGLELRKAYSPLLSTSVRTTTTTTSEGRTPRQSFFGYALNYLF